MNGMKTNIKKLDLEYQHTMLAHHVSEFVRNLPYSGIKGIYVLEDKDLEPIMKRLEVINSIHKMGETEVCEDFAQGDDGDVPLCLLGIGESDNDSITLNEWPSSQICMDCEHGAFIMGEDIPASTYACKRGVQLGPCDSSCSMFEEKEFQEME
jgi:hypothetical protein